MPLAEKIDTLATAVYGADGIDISPAAARGLRFAEHLGFGGLPICMAKTQASLSHDASLKGAREDSGCQYERCSYEPERDS
jgi:formate--tetrahydrofolate ligase